MIVLQILFILLSLFSSIHFILIVLLYNISNENFNFIVTTLDKRNMLTERSKVILNKIRENRQNTSLTQNNWTLFKKIIVTFTTYYIIYIYLF